MRIEVDADRKEFRVQPKEEPKFDEVPGEPRRSGRRESAGKLGQMSTRNWEGLRRFPVDIELIRFIKPDYGAACDAQGRRRSYRRRWVCHYAESILRGRIYMPMEGISSMKMEVSSSEWACLRIIDISQGG